MEKPKPQRTKDSLAMHYVKVHRDGCCMVGLGLRGKYGACSTGLDVHHIENKGAGGDDVPQNLITLCRYHHILAQMHRITRKELRAILTSYYKYEYA